MLQILLDVSPLSINRKIRSSYKRRSNYKSPEAVAFEHEVYARLKKDMHVNALGYAQFKAEILSKPFLDVAYLFVIPKADLITKKGLPSRSGGDVDNYVKPFQDELFKFLKLDDKIIFSSFSAKVPTDSDKRSILVSLVPMSKPKTYKDYGLTTI